MKCINGQALISMLYPTILSVAPQGWIENLTRLLQCLLVYYSLVMSFNSLFGFVLVFGENMSMYTHVPSIFSSLTSSKPFNHILIVRNSDFALCRIKI